MLAIEKSRDLVEQIGRILRRMEHIKEVRTQQSEFLTELQELYTSYAQRTYKEMVVFEEQLIKNILYSAHKTNPIVNLAKLYRDFALQLDRTAKLNLLSLGRIRGEELVVQEGRLTRKCELFLKEFQGYLTAQKVYNAHYNTYSDKCALLDQTIRRYRSYQDPLAFYSHALTSEYIAELDRHYNDCSTFETTIINDTQGLDQTRKWMGDHVKEINEYYVILLHVYLNTVQATINALVEPNPNPPDKPALRSSSADPLDPQPALQDQLQKLNNLYASELNNQQNVEDNVADDYLELFGKSFVQEASSDSKFFYDRCESMRSKKLKTTEEVLRIQRLLIDQLTKQCSSFATFQKDYRAIERDIFTNNGIDSFKKRFRKYFGSNFMEIQQLCFAIVDRQKRSLDRVAKSMEDSRQKLGRLLEGKQESVRFFEKRTKAILEDHQKLKEKAQSRRSFQCDVRTFKESIGVSFNELKKCFQELQKSESQVDKLFFSTLKSHCEIIQKEGLDRNLSRILQKEKIRLNILRSLNVDSQIILILKEDSRYQMLMNECPKPNLYASFQSLTKKKEYDEAKALLQKKENRLKGMMRSKQSCCGITSQPIKNDIRSEHKCKLVANGQKTKGTLNITASGLIFEEDTWMPFVEGLRLTVPQTDIHSFDTRILNEKEVVQVGTDFGSLFFASKSCNQIVQSMQKNITFRPARGEGSEKGKRNDSSSFIKNNTSTEFKLSYDKSLGNGSSTDAFRQPKDKPPSKPKSTDLVKDFIRRWKEENFLGQHFNRIVKKEREREWNRRDYQYSSGANKFVLKERRDVTMEGKDVVLGYEWKVCFPDTPMLHSFKHNQRVIVEGANNDMHVRIVTAPLNQEQLFIRNRFYREIEEMNDRLAKFIVNALQKEANVLIQPENEGEQSLNSSDIIIYETNLDERPERADPTLRVSRSERPRSGSQSPSSILKF